MSQNATDTQTAATSRAARAQATPKQLASMRKLAGALKALGRARGTTQHNSLAVNAYTLLKGERGVSFEQARASTSPV